MKKEIKKIITILLLLITIAVPHSYVIAQETPQGWVPKTYNLLTPIPDGDETLSQDVTFEKYLSAIYKLGISVAIVLAILMITLAGLQYITTPSESGKSSAKNRIWMSVIGLLLALSSWLIVATILGTGVFNW